MSSMTEIIRDFEEYFLEALGLQVKAKAWGKTKELPFFLKEFYTFYEVSLLRRHCILAVAKEGEEIAPATVNKHLKQLQEDQMCIYVKPVITAYNRKRLIQHRVPFVVPGNQMYLPEMAIDLREYFRQLPRKSTTFSPAAQTVVIYGLIHQEKKFTPSELAKKLGYTAMTMTRALDELESLGIGEFFREGKERFVYFAKTLWEQANPFLRSPVKQRKWVRFKKGKEERGRISGLSALAEYSMLNRPECPIYAVDAKEWKKLKQKVEELPFPEEADAEIEIWRYDPGLFAKGRMVDPFSLYLSLRENRDERVEAALGKLMGRMKW